uniref:Uncharacterized protein n=1 Tax=Nelumbo nucifera TaxID=4432 RepID=A0A822Z4K6_NELNU|nr:TPA_asm: hypothetical protein HUJ06_013883 [Nelumbo nucifera]
MDLVNEDDVGTRALCGSYWVDIILVLHLWLLKKVLKTILSPC